MQQAIAELGYRPNLAARALVTGSTRTIGLVTVKINQYGPAQTMLGLEKAARAAGYSLSVSILDDATAEAMREAVDRFVAQSVDAVVALSTYDDAAEALHSHRRAGAAGRRAGGRGRGPAGRRAWTRRPARGWPPGTCSTLGHRTVHHVGGPGGLAGGPRPHRRAGARSCDAAGAPVPEILRGDWTPSSGYAAGRQLAARIRAGEDVTAVFLANDQMALGLLAALHEEGLEMPDDVSVVGFDDLPEAPYFTPPLTTVRQDFAELGRRGRAAGARPAGRARTCTREPVPAPLLVRASTGPARPCDAAAGLDAGDVSANIAWNRAVTPRSRRLDEEDRCRRRPVHGVTGTVRDGRVSWHDDGRRRGDHRRSHGPGDRARVDPDQGGADRSRITLRSPSAATTGRTSSWTGCGRTRWTPSGPGCSRASRPWPTTCGDATGSS